jgi:hypothetical protein
LWECWVLLGVVGCCWVLLGVVGCCWVLLVIVGDACWFQSSARNWIWIWLVVWWNSEVGRADRTDRSTRLCGSHPIWRKTSTRHTWMSESHRERVRVEWERVESNHSLYYMMIELAVWEWWYNNIWETLINLSDPTRKRLIDCCLNIVLKTSVKETQHDGMLHLGWSKNNICIKSKSLDCADGKKT